MLNEQSQVPLQQQQLLYNGREMKNSEKLSSLGVSDGDLVMLVSKASSSSRCIVLFAICQCVWASLDASFCLFFI